MTYVSYLILYLVVSLIVTYLVTCTFALRHSKPDRRKKDRRVEDRPGHFDRRASYRAGAEELVKN